MDDSETDSSARPASGGAARGPRRPRQRRDPAEMRATLDAARRRLGPADHPDPGAPPQSAERQRALLREAAANQSLPAALEPNRGHQPATEPEPDDVELEPSD